MKLNLKKFVGLLLPFAFMLAILTPALATSTETEGALLNIVTPTSTATVVVGVTGTESSSAKGGDELLAYKVIAIAYNDINNTVTKSFNALFKAFQDHTLGA